MSVALGWALGGALAGLIIGSFIATLVLRWPAGRTLAGRSRCDICHRALHPRELVPLLSYALQRGHCRGCGAAIDVRHPLIEVSAGLIGAAALYAVPGWWGLTGAVFGWQLLALATLDLEHHWLPDRLNVALALTGLAVVPFTFSPESHLIGAAAGFVSLATIRFGYKALRGREGMGGGDPKLFGAIGLWLGWWALPLVLLAASLIGLIAVVIAQLRGQSVKAATRLPLGTLLAVAAFPAWVVLNA